MNICGQYLWCQDSELAAFKHMVFHYSVVYKVWNPSDEVWNYLSFWELQQKNLSLSQITWHITKKRI